MTFHLSRSISLQLMCLLMYLLQSISICLNEIKSQFSMGACKMRFNWRNFLIGFSLVYALLKTLLFLYFLCKSIYHLVQEDEDDFIEYITQYTEIFFLSFLILSLALLFYGTIKVNFQLINSIRFNSNYFNCF